VPFTPSAPCPRQIPTRLRDTPHQVKLLQERLAGAIEKRTGAKRACKALLREMLRLQLPISSIESCS